MTEENLRRAMTISRDDPTGFITRPLSLLLLTVALLLLAVMLVPSIAKRRQQTFSREIPVLCLAQISIPIRSKVVYITAIKKRRIHR